MIEFLDFNDAVDVSKLFRKFEISQKETLAVKYSERDDVIKYYKIFINKKPFGFVALLTDISMEHETYKYSAVYTRFEFEKEIQLIKNNPRSA